MDNKLVVKTVFNPERDTAKAKRAADQLIDIVKQNGWSKKFGGEKEHIFYEGWQTLGKYYNISIATGEAEPVEIGGVSGFRAKAWAIDNRTGVKVGEAEAYCMRDENNWKAKPTFQLASMAQTRAGSKALRQIFGFVVALAGYEATPAEEMTGEENRSETATLKQITFIQKLLTQKGYPQSSIKVKYGVEINALTKEQASSIIENLTQLPDALVGEADPLPEIDIDKVDEALNEDIQS